MANCEDCGKEIDWECLDEYGLRPDCYPDVEEKHIPRGGSPNGE